jgi:hypothetical protein
MTPEQFQEMTDKMTVEEFKEYCVTNKISFILSYASDSDINKAAACSFFINSKNEGNLQHAMSKEAARISAASMCISKNLKDQELIALVQFLGELDFQKAYLPNEEEETPKYLN